MKQLEICFVVLVIILLALGLVFGISEHIRQTCTLQEFKNVNTKQASFSLSTLPSRIKHIEPTIQSLVIQEPKTIYLHIPFVCKRTGEKYVIPKWLDKYSKIVKVIRPEDRGPATKFLGLLDCDIDPVEYICVVDDDQIYNKYLLSNLLYKAINSPDNHVISSVCEFTNIDVMGCFGYLFKRKLLDNISHFKHPKECFLVDDAWITAYFKQNNIPITRLFPVFVTYFSIYDTPKDIFEMYKMIFDIQKNPYRKKVQEIDSLYPRRQIDENLKCILKAS
jgi:hypothetical protein